VLGVDCPPVVLVPLVKEENKSAKLLEVESFPWGSPEDVPPGEVGVLGFVPNNPLSKEEASSLAPEVAGVVLGLSDVLGDGELNKFPNKLLKSLVLEEVSGDVVAGVGSGEGVGAGAGVGAGVGAGAGAGAGVDTGVGAGVGVVSLDGSGDVVLGVVVDVFPNNDAKGFVSSFDDGVVEGVEGVVDVVVAGFSSSSSVFGFANNDQFMPSPDCYNLGKSI
jgi:hypothetical protein